jgi:hypothetical protein
MSNDKQNLLLELLKERYEAAHQMRQRGQNFTVWILGLGIALAWKLLDGNALDSIHKIIITVFVLGIAYYSKDFIECIEMGFERNRELIKTIEEELGLYADGFCKSGAPLYPHSYRDLSKKNTHHFSSLKRLLCSVQIFLISFIWIDEILYILKSLICKC